LSPWRAKSTKLQPTPATLNLSGLLYLVEYRQGISEEYNSFDGIVEWQRTQLVSTFSHVREVFCIASRIRRVSGDDLGCPRTCVRRHVGSSK